ncbi:predicted protein [Histoplasma capsulatum var. duboisii H88]|uniref:Predicted protein n=1 Tax=Ajellomyces capsulatus (strain H88) TaxID=544711 RepID=F0U5Z9_AJEC8|nr:predicted protein [Histoplasma capsulatum var. duboisii H88]QSS52190.1 hypothetical protein I7I53_07738 [Histoplasma capsulatum var. duboisii H88]
MPSLHGVLKLKLRHPANLSKLREMETPSEPSDHPVPGGRLRDSWTAEQDQNLLRLQVENHFMTIREIQKAFFPNRSFWAVTKRLSVLKQGEKQKISRGSPPLTNESSNRHRRTTSPQYVYSEDGSEDMSLDSQSDVEDIAEGHASDGGTSSKRSAIHHRGLSDTLKRKISVEKDVPSPSPSKLSKPSTASAPMSVDPCSAMLPNGKTPTTTGYANTAVDVANDSDNLDNKMSIKLSRPSSIPTWMDQAREEDIVQMFRQAKRCAAESKLATELACRLSDANSTIDRYRDENSQLKELKKKYDGFKESLEDILKKRNEKQKQLKEENEAQKLKQLEQISQLKAEFDKIRGGASKVIHPDMWKSGGMDAAAVQAAKIMEQMEDTLKAEVPSGKDTLLTSYLMKSSVSTASKSAG